jgi:hypothetical protein
VYLPIQLDVCQQPTRTSNLITTDIKAFIYPEMFQRITASSSGGHLFKNTVTPLKILKVLKTLNTVAFIKMLY